MILTIIAFVITLSLLVIVHELGHFVAAKKAGIRVEEFGLGYPPRVFGIRKGETIYSINLLPFGGFVKIYGQIGEETVGEKPGKLRGLIIGDKPPKTPKDSEKHAFYNQPLRIRTVVLAAGVIMNLVLAMFLLAFGYWFGLPALVEENGNAYLTDPKVQVLQVAPGSPAEEAGIMMGDTIKALKVNDKFFEITSIDELIGIVSAHKGEEILMTLQKGSQEFTVRMVPRVEYPGGEGPLGVALARTAIIRYPWYEAIYKGITDTFYLTGVIVLAFASLFKQLFTSGQLTADVAGPVGIFNLTGQAAHLGFAYVLQFIALFSINLAIINALPLPALDGGRLLFLLIEKVKGSPVSQQVEKWAHTAGFALIILLMLAITWRDIAKLF